MYSQNISLFIPCTSSIDTFHTVYQRQEGHIKMAAQDAEEAVVTDVNEAVEILKGDDFRCVKSPVIYFV